MYITVFNAGYLPMGKVTDDKEEYIPMQPLDDPDYEASAGSVTKTRDDSNMKAGLYWYKSCIKKPSENGILKGYFKFNNFVAKTYFTPTLAKYSFF